MDAPPGRPDDWRGPLTELDRIESADPRDLLAFLEDAIARDLRIVVVGTHYAYTDESFPKFPDILIPIIKVITGPVPSSTDQMAMNISTTGFGADAAKNAALFAARVLASNDPDLEARLAGFVL